MAEAVRPRTQVSTSDLGEQIFQAIKKNHDKTHADVKLALSSDEKGLFTQAIEFYQRALKSISKGLVLNCSGPECIGQRWEQARKLQEKMRKTAHQIKARLEGLEQELKPSLEKGNDQRQSGLHPSTSGNGASSITTFQDSHSARNEPPQYTRDPATAGWEETVAMDLTMNMAIERDLEALEDPPSYEQTLEDAYKIYSIDEGVQMYFISSAGHVSAPSSPESLKIYKFVDEDRGREAGQPPAFLQIGDWLYPLVPGHSPALRSSDGAYLFPDFESSDRGACVGIIVPPNLSSTKLQEFQNTIQNLTALRTQTLNHEPLAPSVRSPTEFQEKRIEEGKEDTEKAEASEGGMTTSIAKGIETGATWLSWGLGKGAILSGQLLNKGATKLKQHIQPAEDPVEFDEKYQRGAHYAKKATGVVVTVSGVVVDGLCYMTTKLGEVAVPVIREQTDKLIKKGDKGQENGKWSKVVNGTVEVAASSIKGFGVVYNGLEVAGKSLAKSIHNSTVDVVNHRYGKPAATMTSNSMATVGNVGVSIYNFKSLGVKAIAKRTAKDTGKALVNDYESDGKIQKITDKNAS